METALKTRDRTHETEITGKIIHIYYSSESFSAGVLAAQDGPLLDRDCRFCIKSPVQLGDEITLHGKWTYNTKFNCQQFDAQSLSYPMPDLTAEGLADYLSNNPAFVGIGPAKARLIAERFGADFDSAIRNAPELVAQAGKLSPDSIKTLREEWIARADFNAISTWLAAYGLTHNQIRRISERYGNRAQQVLGSNPYVLCDELDGFGFARTDEIALKMGIEKSHPGRIRACLLELVKNESDEGGHTYIERRELVRKAITKLAFDSLDADSLVREQMGHLCSDLDDGTPSLLISVTHQGLPLIAVRRLYELEMDIHRWLSQDTARLAVAAENVDTMIDHSAQMASVAQREGIRSALTNRISVISGGAGTGKSFTVAAIYRIFERLGLSVGMCAPTGKAAKRMSSLADGADACTIHRLLAYCPLDGGFSFNANNKLPHDLVIVDEVSMCDIRLLWHLFSAIDWDRTQVLLVGDHNQLPPIGAGNVLRDVLEHKLVPMCILSECFRNAGNLKLNCNALLHGKLAKSTDLLPQSTNREWHLIDDREDPELVVEAVRCLMQTYFQEWGFDPVQDCQIITPYNKGKLGVNRLNLELQRIWQRAKYGIELPAVTAETWDKRPGLLLGDKVMQIKNDYRADVMNGTQGVVVDVREGGKSTVYVIQFDDHPCLVEVKSGSKELQNIVLAYACTVHKVQGSEYPCVVSIIHKTHTYMLSRNLIYTAATRARKTAILIGDRLGMRRAIQNTASVERRTWLNLLGQGATNE